MEDRVRYTSVPPKGTTDPATVVNPSYSSANISTASETASVTPIVDIELAPFHKRVLSEPKYIKLALISLAVGFLVLLLLNAILITIWAASSPSTTTITKYVMITQELMDRFENRSSVVPTADVSTTTDAPTTVPTQILLSTATQLSTTTALPSTTSSSVSEEIMNREYLHFARRFIRETSEARRLNFVDNYEFFTWNGEGVNVAETQFADLSLNELKKIVNTNRDRSRSEERFLCRKINEFLNSETMVLVFDLHNNSRIPARIDLRRIDKMPKARNQGTTCNAGYAFATVAQMDYFEGKSFSAQYLLCDGHNFHCQGGEVFKARQTVTTIGIPEERELPFSESQKWCDGSYNLQQLFNKFRNDKIKICMQHKTTPCFALSFVYHYANRTLNRPVSTDELISAILTRYGPAVIEVPVDRSFFFYKGGIYKPKCTEIIGYQPVIVVGYDKRDGVDVWILRNSFGTDWGISGDFEMEKGVKYEDSNCDAFAYAIY